MLQNGLGLVCFDTFRHHVIYIHDHSRSQLQVILRLNSLLSYSLSCALRVSPLELSSQQIPQPTFQEWNDTSEEEKPDSPAGGPETDTRAFANWTGIETIIDQVFEILSHTYLPHQTILITIHTCKLAYMGKDVLKTVSKLESLNVTQAILDM